MDEPSRRTLLAAGAAGLAAVAGCSKYGEPKTAPTTPPQTGTSVIRTGDIPVAGGVILGDRQVVVTQPTAGTYKAFTSVCTHQGCQVANVANGTINCECHGSKFAIANGSVVNGPATQPLASKQIRVSGDTITLT